MKQPKRNRKKLPPTEPWQTGDFERELKAEIQVPYPVLMLCKLWDVKPVNIITDFLDNLAHAAWKKEGRDAAKQKLVEYILLSRYAKEHYTETDLLQMFKELDAMGMLFPNNASDKVLDSYVDFRESFYQHWFNHWYYKWKRREP